MHYLIDIHCPFPSLLSIVINCACLEACDTVPAQGYAQWIGVDICFVLQNDIRTEY